jgi:hypothetical protein
MNGSDQQGWTAIHDFTPSKPGLLRVRGQCTFPTPGYRVELRKAVPQGVHKKILVLNKIVMPPKGKQAQVVTTVMAEYRETTQERYAEVEILPDNIRVPIRESH